MKSKKYKFVGVRVEKDFHAEFFKALKKQSKIIGRPVSASEIIIPALKHFVVVSKNDSQ